MKDLYRANGLSPKDSAETIAARLKRQPMGDPNVKAADAILLDGRRRGAYDRHRELALRIGAMRGATGLTKTPYWSRHTFRDFTPLWPWLRRKPTVGLGERTAAYTAGRFLAKASRSSATRYLVVMAVIVGFLSFAALEERSNPPSSTTVADALRESSPAAIELPDEAPSGTSYDFSRDPIFSRPANGEMLKDTTSRSGFSSPFTVRTRAGADYVVKLVDADNRSRKLAFYVRGGEQARVQVPAGNWELRYLSGLGFKSEQMRFARKEVSAVAEDQFPIHLAKDRSYEIWTVELIRQRDGNLRTSRISPSDF